MSNNAYETLLRERLSLLLRRTIQWRSEVQNAALEVCHVREPFFPLTVFIYQKITSYAGSRIKPVNSWLHLRKLSLADQDPFSNHIIYLLIGADLYGLLHDIIQGPIGTPTAQLITLDWILSGPIGNIDLEVGSKISVHSLNCILNLLIDSLLQKFWEIEEISSEPQLSEEDKRYEQHYLETHRRAADGRYIVRLPFKTSPSLDIGASCETTALLYSKLERCLQKNLDLAN